MHSTWIVVSVVLYPWAISHFCTIEIWRFFCFCKDTHQPTFAFKTNSTCFNQFTISIWNSGEVTLVTGCFSWGNRNLKSYYKLQTKMKGMNFRYLRTDTGTNPEYFNYLKKTKEESWLLIKHQLKMEMLNYQLILRRLRSFMLDEKKVWIQLLENRYLHANISQSGKMENDTIILNSQNWGLIRLGGIRYMNAGEVLREMYWYAQRESRERYQQTRYNIWRLFNQSNSYYFMQLL